MRIQLSFSDSNIDHTRVHRYLSSMTKRTDYIVGLVMRDLLGKLPELEHGQNPTSIQVPSTPPALAIDYDRLAGLLREEMAALMMDTVKTALLEMAPLKNGIQEQAQTPPAPQAENEDLSLALEGLKVFGLLGGEEG